MHEVRGMPLPLPMKSRVSGPSGFANCDTDVAAIREHGVIRPPPRACFLGAAVAFLACSGDPGNRSGTPGDAGSGGGGGTTGDAGSGGGGRGGGGGGGGTGGTGDSPCSIYGLPVTSTISGVGFGAWEGQPVQGCFFPAQSFVYSCSSSVVVDGGFSLTASVCTGVRWGAVVVGSGAQAVDCFGAQPLMPANCGCHDPANPSSGAAGGRPGQDCDGGTPDAQ
jgi:hypothetical protein